MALSITQKIIFALVIFYTIIGYTHCETKGIDPCALHHSNEIRYDLIKDWVKNKRIIAIGESSHGIGGFYTFKTELVKYLHKELGFDVLAMEAGFGDINLAWLDIDSLHQQRLMDKTVYGNFNCKELAPLFDHIKTSANTRRPLIYAGYDPQVSSSYYTDLLDSINNVLALNIDVQQELEGYTRMYQSSFEPDSTSFTTYKTRYQLVIKQFIKSIRDNKNKLKTRLGLSPLGIDILIRNLQIQYEAVDYNYVNKMSSDYIPQGIIIRDKLMAENIKWLIDTLYPNKRFIIWGHNGHINRGGIIGQTSKWMGEYLKSQYADQYFSIGLFAAKGQVYQQWTGESIDFENTDSIAIEQIMYRDSSQYAYQKMSIQDSSHWTNKMVTGFELESMGNISFVPSTRFDAVISLSNVGISSY